MNAQMMRANADHCVRMARESTDEIQKQRLLRAAMAWTSVADNKEKLDASLLPDEAVSVVADTENAA
jgi:hypothetical protein